MSVLINSYQINTEISYQLNNLPDDIVFSIKSFVFDSRIECYFKLQQWSWYEVEKLRHERGRVLFINGRHSGITNILLEQYFNVLLYNHSIMQSRNNIYS